MKQRSNSLLYNNCSKRNNSSFDRSLALKFSKTRPGEESMPVRKVGRIACDAFSILFFFFFFPSTRSCSLNCPSNTRDCIPDVCALQSVPSKTYTYQKRHRSSTLLYIIKAYIYRHNKCVYSTDKSTTTTSAESQRFASLWRIFHGRAILHNRFACSRRPPCNNANRPSREKLIQISLSLSLSLSLSFSPVVKRFH